MPVKPGHSTHFSIPAIRRTSGGLLLAMAIAAPLAAQTAAPAAKSTAAAPAAASGFSIETEMLTYRALESNSEAIACDVAAYINGTTADFDHAPRGAACDVGAGSHKDPVLVLPFDKTQLANFQIWSSDMATMARLQEAARSVNCPAPPPGATRAGSLLSMTPAGPPLALATGTLALLASDQSSTSVGGTIKDQAFMDGVARELRSLSVPVLMPSAYSPNAMSTLDEQTSPYLTRRAKVIAALGCIDAYKATGADDPLLKQVQQTVLAIQSFLASIGEGASTPAVTTKPNANNPAPAQPATDSAKPPAVDAAAASAHLSAAMLADGLARQLGVLPATGTFPTSAPPQHILLVQALESGGSVIKLSNVLGTRIRYSGGSVGTYALFNADGTLECSGNVYDYAGSLKANDFKRGGLNNLKVYPGKQVIFLHSCSAHPSSNTPANNNVVH